MDIAWLNGEFLPLDEARISPMDRGFLFGDAVYEVMPAYHGQPFLLERHLQRLDQSLNRIRISNPNTTLQWTSILEELVNRNMADKPANTDLFVYLQVSRGVQARRNTVIGHEGAPTLFAYCQTLPEMSEHILAHGVSAITQPDNRWGRCDIKSTSLIANVLLANIAADNDCNEVILYREDLLTEGASSTVFAVMDNVLHTPPVNNQILPGVTRGLVLELAEQLHIPNQIRDISMNELRRADEIWITSSTRELFPVTKLDGEKIGKGRPGPVWKAVHDAYQQYKTR